MGSVVQKTSYELQNLRASLYSWSQLPNAEYFTPNGEALLAIVTIEELLCASNRPDRDVWKELEPLKNEAFVQLQGCLVDLLEAPNVEAGLSQGVFLLGKLGKLLMDVDTEFIVKGLVPTENIIDGRPQFATCERFCCWNESTLVFRISSSGFTIAIVGTDILHHVLPALRIPVGSGGGIHRAAESR